MLNVYIKRFTFFTSRYHWSSILWNERERPIERGNQILQKNRSLRDYPWLANRNGFTGVEWPTNNKTLVRAYVEGPSIVDRLLPGLGRQSAFVEGENKVQGIDWTVEESDERFQ